MFIVPVWDFFMFPDFSSWLFYHPNSLSLSSDFDRDGSSDAIRFMIKRIKIHNQNALSDPGYRWDLVFIYLLLLLLFILKLRAARFRISNSLI